MSKFKKGDRVRALAEDWPAKTGDIYVVISVAGSMYDFRAVKERIDDAHGWSMRDARWALADEPATVPLDAVMPLLDRDGAGIDGEEAGERIVARMETGADAVLQHQHNVQQAIKAGVVKETPDQTTVSGSILTEALDITQGARNTTHGAKERSFKAIAGLWNAYLDARLDNDADLTPRNVTDMMVLMKVGRSIQGTAHRDHFVDMAGYAALSGELAAAEAL